MPSKTPCSVVLDDYVATEKAKRPAGSADQDILEEIDKGLKAYFGLAVGRILLYKQERLQYSHLCKRIRDPSDDLAGKQIYEIYGAEHLIRLLGMLSSSFEMCIRILTCSSTVTMPELIAQTNMDQQSVSRLREELIKLTMWLAIPENIKKYFSVPYANE